MVPLHTSPFLRSPRMFLAGLAILLLTACGGGGSTPPPPTPPAPGATLTALVLSPTTATLAPGGTRQFTAMGTYSDGSSRDISATASWTSATPAIVTVSNTGLAAAMTAGTATISATTSGVTGQAVVTVTSASATLTAISITPSNPSIAKGGTRQLTAMGAYSDGTSRDLSSTVTWTSGTPAIATVNSTGLVTGVTAGTASISAASGAVSAQASVTVSPATLQSLAITPANPSITVGGTKAFTATGTFSDGSTGAVAATWSSSANTIASITTSGVATGLAAGSTTITATANGVSATTTLVVSGATLTSLQVTPANPSVAAGSITWLTATGTYSDGSTATLTTSVTWSSSSTAIAQVYPSGQVTGVAAGTATITATLGSKSATAALTVTAPKTVTAIQVSPASATVALNGVQTYQAIVTWSDGSALNMSYDVAWTSLDNAIATIDNLGEATGHAAGTTTIRATYGGVTGQGSITVTAPTLTSISMNPATATLNVGGTVDITSTGNFSNGVSTVPYDSHLTWTSSAPSVATVNAGGVVTAVGAGTTTIRATAGSVVGTATITVNGPSFDPALVGSWQWIGTPNPVDFSNYGSFYHFYADGTFTYTLIYDAGTGCITTQKVVAFHSGTFSSAPGQIILYCTTLYDDYTNCSNATQRIVKTTPATQIHEASFSGGQLGTRNQTNDFTATGWLWHTKQ